MLAYIPARGGSKSIPQKNIVDFLGKPLLAHTIEKALAVNVFSKVIVSTDNSEIAQIAQNYGAQVIERPAELSQDHSTNLDGVRHALNYLAEIENYKPESFCILQPTSPLKRVENIQEACERFLDKKADALVSVTECKHHPYKTLKVISKDKIEPMISWDTMVQSRQILDKFYLPNGAIHCCNVNFFLERNVIFSENMEIYFMPEAESVDIDGAVDLELARIVSEKYL